MFSIVTHPGNEGGRVAVDAYARYLGSAILLCDVLGWAAAEAATLLGGSTASINSALQRARETLAKRNPDGRLPVASRPNPAQQNSSAAIYRPGKGMIWTASWPS
jgi:hypothetical protein